MTVRLLTRFTSAAAVVVAAGAWVAAPLVAQERPGAAAPAASSAAGKGTRSSAAASAASYKVPRTPWGDPDLQGGFTNLFEAGTPLERPKQFEGRNLSEISDRELSEFKAEVRNRTITNFEGPIHAPDHWWQVAYDPVKGKQAWFIVDPADGKIPALTAAAQRRQAARDEARKQSTRGPADSWEDRSLYDRCITRGMPGSMMPGIYGNSYEIVQGPGFVAIRYEMIHETRVIPLDEKAHVGRAIPLDMGDARGHWEGDTLVVETRNFKERSVFRNANPDTLRLIERFTRTSPDTVSWSVTVDDPETWVRPWTFSMPLTINSAEPLMPYECHEGNYGLRNILSAARAEERAVADGQAPASASPAPR